MKGVSGGTVFLIPLISLSSLSSLGLVLEMRKRGKRKKRIRTRGPLHHQAGKGRER